MWLQVQKWVTAFSSIFRTGGFLFSPADGITIQPTPMEKCLVDVTEKGLLLAEENLKSFWQAEQNSDK